MKYFCPLIAVTDMENSKKFYHDILGCSVINDFGANVTLTGGFSLQTLDTWTAFIETHDVTLQSRSGELYFEEDDIGSFIKHLSSYPGIRYVHPLKEHSWGQRVVRFYDPDGHIIEVGESMGAVARRFLDLGMTTAETAARMDVSEDFVISCTER